MTTALYPTFEKRIADATDHLIRVQVDPWSFMRQRLRVQRFDGRTISYEGGEFEGSPQQVFWSRYIEPFLEDLAIKEISAAVSSAKERGIDARELLPEVQGLLLAACRKTLRCMADVDRRLRGKGYPQQVPERSIDSEYQALREFIEKHVQSELVMWDPARWYELWYERNKFWVWVVTTLVAVVGLATRFL